MTDGERGQIHAERLALQIAEDVRAKYVRGQQEHGGHLPDKAGLLDHAIQEVLDLAVYLYTLRDQVARLSAPGE